MGPRLRGAKHLVSCFADAILKFLTLFEQEGLRFHFALGPANYVASPATGFLDPDPEEDTLEGRALLC